MADMLTPEKLINADIDVEKLGEAANENKIVNPRYGNPYYSAPMAVQHIMDMGGWDSFPTQAELQASTPTTTTKVAIALDTGFLWRFSGGVWANTNKKPFQEIYDYVNANPRFLSVNLTGTENLDELPEGRYFIKTPAVATALDSQLPAAATSPKVGWVEKTYNSNGLIELEFTRYTANAQGEYEIFRKTSNGGSSSIIWLDWKKDVSRYEFDSLKAAATSDISDLKEHKAEINLFPDYALTSNLARTYQATLADENGYPTLTMNTGGVTLVDYDVGVVSNIVDVGKTISFSAEIFCTATGTRGGDVSIQALSGSGSVLQSSTSAYNTKANEFEKITASLTLPVGTTKIRLRMINRNGTGNTLCKFRDAKLFSNYVFLKYLNPIQQNGSNSSGIFFVSKSGNDSSNGTEAAPFATLQKALNSLPSQGGVIELGGGFYRETATISSKGDVWIRSKRNERAVIFGSDQLVVSKSTGYTQVYQAPLAAKPVGMGGSRGKPVIFEWGTPSKPILDSDRNHLHRSRTHRLPYTEMFEAASLAELDTVGGRGKWWWDAGVIYFAATDGGDATLKQYEARVRPTIIQTGGVLHMTRVDAFFSTNEGGQFNGVLVDREDCRAFGNYYNGWSDNCNITKSLYDEAGGNGNDGMNGTVTIYNIPDVNTRLTAHYIEPYVHDNGDDGLSYHYRSNVRISGGYGEYNTKADFVHVTGATCVCDGTESNGTMNGFYIATTATGDSERTASYFKCKNTTARNNTYSYHAADDAVMHCDNTKAVNPAGFGYYQTGVGRIVCEDAKYRGDPSKMKSGNVVVENFETVT